ncbi:hypothetical protein [Mycobacteroides franklinii]|uniref:Uncharacterized protein n=1 Tax=Mycobacteroides franklinii TaxID=948102 RepID=A0A4R8R9V8_9MYCO|nr:hypothetical protein [Mycobacteroides franklinii]TDZ43083.1 hypothetical protein CCUG64054_03134 [Mycobacteroides franklinii]TDZ50217.1 hypothetical protein CCUG63697_01719 [Mycobacteroides franklinii]TDZ56638.1 hypothetical protein CCUG63696_03136 [Mycobacteroides franklinii]TDZ63579.1 hypothetical protein CCUG63695_03061 [Mycobacteroides franklinii]TDZ69976.1 hypothetical protein CCUG64056_03134 [Mycobacteroides franklinii]
MSDHWEPWGTGEKAGGGRAVVVPLLVSVIGRWRWWHSWRGHRMWCDIDRHRMVTVCVCGRTWVDIGESGSSYV